MSAPVITSAHGPFTYLDTSMYNPRFIAPIKAASVSTVVTGLLIIYIHRENNS